MVIDHIGIVVASLEKGIREWKHFFDYRQSSGIATNTRQKVRVVFLSKEGSVAVKLVEPTEPTSPIARFAQKGGGLHHLCFRCEDLEVEVPVIRSKGARFLVLPEPGEAFNNKKIAFFLGPDNLNCELIDTTEKASLL